MPNSNLGSINLNGVSPKEIMVYLEFLPQTTDQITCPFCLDRYNGKVMGENLSLDKCPVCKGKRFVTGKLIRPQWGQYIGADFELNSIGGEVTIDNTYKMLDDIPKEFLDTADEDAIKQYKDRLSTYCKCYIYIKPYTVKSVEITNNKRLKRKYFIAPSNKPIKKIQMLPLTDITNKDIYDIDIQNAIRNTIPYMYNVCWGSRLDTCKLEYEIVEGGAA